MYSDDYIAWLNTRFWLVNLRMHNAAVCSVLLAHIIHWCY